MIESPEGPYSRAGSISSCDTLIMHAGDEPHPLQEELDKVLVSSSSVFFARGSWGVSYFGSGRSDPLISPSLDIDSVS